MSTYDFPPDLTTATSGAGGKLRTLKQSPDYSSSRDNLRSSLLLHIVERLEWLIATLPATVSDAPTSGVRESEPIETREGVKLLRIVFKIEPDDDHVLLRFLEVHTLAAASSQRELVFTRS